MLSTFKYSILGMDIVQHLLDNVYLVSHYPGDNRILDVDVDHGQVHLGVDKDILFQVFDHCNQI